MNKFICILFVLFCSHLTQAQFLRDKIINLENYDKATLNWGYFLGLNQYDFQFEYQPGQEDIVVEKSMGFSVGLIGELRLSEHFDLRIEPGLFYTSRNMTFPGFTEQRDMFREVPSTYIHFPLLIKASTKRLNNFKPFIIGGVSTSINLSSNQDNPDDNGNGQFRMTKNTYYYELGFGVDFYLFYFKFAPSIRGVFAFNDELVRDMDGNSPWTSGINKMSTRGIFINFTFE
jgi:hypothetical protein